MTTTSSTSHPKEPIAEQLLAAAAAMLSEDQAALESESRKRLLQRHEVMTAAAAEIKRLGSAVLKANDQAERFERGWYLRGDALEKLQDWANAYPLEAFPKPDLKRAHEILQAHGMTLDAISADAMRHVIGQTRKIVADGLSA